MKPYQKDHFHWQDALSKIWSNLTYPLVVNPSQILRGFYNMKTEKLFTNMFNMFN